MSVVSVIDENGVIVRKTNSLTPVQADNPAYRARIVMAIGKRTWLCRPNEGHTLDQYKNVQATAQNKENYQKIVKQYLAPYGATVTSAYLASGVVGLTTQVSKETIDG